MVAHIVLFRPKQNITEANRQSLFDSLRVASSEIPTVKRFHIGKRITHGRAYEKLMAMDYPYAAVIEFADLEGLKAYLEHPKHQALGNLFDELSDGALIYDYEMMGVEGSMRSLR